MMHPRLLRPSTSSLNLRRLQDLPLAVARLRQQLLPKELAQTRQARSRHGQSKLAELEAEELLEKVRTLSAASFSRIHSYAAVQLEETNEQLATLNPETLSPSMLRAIQRHRELFQDNSRELKRTKVGGIHLQLYAMSHCQYRLVFRMRWTRQICLQV